MLHFQRFRCAVIVSLLAIGWPAWSLSGLIIKSDDVTISNLTIAGTPTQRFDSAIERPGDALYNRTVIDNVSIDKSGTAVTGAIDLGQLDTPFRSSGNVVRNSSITDANFAGIVLKAGEAEITNNSIEGVVGAGVYVQSSGMTFNTPALVNVTANTISNAGIGVRIMQADTLSVIGGTAGQGNTFSLGAAGVPTYGVVVEW